MGIPKIGVIADDLTGALDTGVQFHNAGLRCRMLLEYPQPVRKSAVRVLVVNTESRSAAPEEARARVRRAAARLYEQGVLLYYKKMDSLLRGPWRHELEALQDFLGGKEVLLCPAFPDQGRVVRDGQIWLDGGAAVGDLRAPGRNWRIPEANTNADLEHLGRMIREQNLLPCGSAGLAAAWASTFTEPTTVAEKKRRLRPRRCKRVLVVAGSMHPVTRKQVATLHEQLAICQGKRRSQKSGTGGRVPGPAGDPSARAAPSYRWWRCWLRSIPKPGPRRTRKLRSDWR